MSSNTKDVNVLFVCLGNICRSPAAEAILQHMVKDNPRFHIYIESCGIGDWHLGSSPDKRMQASAAARGFPMTSIAKLFKPHYLDRFDYILAADQEILHALYQFAPTTEQKSKIHLMSAFSATYYNQDIPDPYYQGQAGFELVLDMLEDACHGLLEHIKKSSE